MVPLPPLFACRAGSSRGVSIFRNYRPFSCSLSLHHEVGAHDECLPILIFSMCDPSCRSGRFALYFCILFLSFPRLIRQCLPTRTSNSRFVCVALPARCIFRHCFSGCFVDPTRRVCPTFVSPGAKPLPTRLIAVSHLLGRQLFRGRAGSRSPLRSGCSTSIGQ